MRAEGIDPLDFFHDLEERKRPKAEDKTYPGSTPPRNPATLDSDEDLWLTSLPFHEFSVNGVVRKFYSIGALARALGNKPVTIRSWEHKGWLPPASFRTPTPRSDQIPGKATLGRRLYSQEQVVFLTDAYATYVLNPRTPNWPGFRQHIKTQYPR